MSSKKGKKPKGKTMTLQNFLQQNESNTPSYPTAETQNKSLRRPNRTQQPQQKRDGNSDSLNWRGLENTNKPETQQSKYVHDKHLQENSNVKYETHMDDFDRNKAHDNVNDYSSVSLQTNQRSEFSFNNNRVLSLGRGRGRAPFSKDITPIAGPWQTKQNQDHHSAFHPHDREASAMKFKVDEPSSQNTAWRTPNINNGLSRGQKASEDRDYTHLTCSPYSSNSNEGSPSYAYSEDNVSDTKPPFKVNEQLDTNMKAFDLNQSEVCKQNTETKDDDWVSEPNCDDLESVKSSTAEESCPVDKKPKVHVKPEIKSRPGSSGVSSSTGATKKKPNEVYIPPNLRPDAKLGDNRDKQFKKPNSSLRNRSRSRDEKHGQRSRSHSSSSNRHHSQDRKMDKNTRQSRGDNVQRCDVFDQFSKWEDSNYTKMAIKCKLSEVKGDLFDASPEYALAHCVAEDFGMGSGIAVQFRQQFKRVDDLLDQRTRQGGVAYLKEKERYIFYMVTKKKSSGKPTYASFCKSLDTLRQKIEEFNVKKLAIPRIGCGLDRLEWSTIWKMIEFIFAKTDVEIVAYNYVQKSSDTKINNNVSNVIPKKEQNATQTNKKDKKKNKKKRK